MIVCIDMSACLCMGGGGAGGRMHAQGRECVCVRHYFASLRVNEVKTANC